MTRWAQKEHCATLRAMRFTPSGALSAQAIEQLAISGLARYGQADLGNRLRLRAPQTWQVVWSNWDRLLHEDEETRWASTASLFAQYVP